jgi:RNA polymerase sigma-70 factor, ECF subfamily
LTRKYIAPDLFLYKDRAIAHGLQQQLNAYHQNLALQFEVGNVAPAELADFYWVFDPKPKFTVEDEFELERLYDEHAQALFAFLMNLTRDVEDTREVMQEVFIKLARQPGILDGARDQRAFLLRLAHNTAIDLMRRRGTRAKYQERFGLEEMSLFAVSSDPDEAAFRAELAAAMAELPVEQRAVVHLKLSEGLTFEQIAATLDLKPNTAASRYRYGLDKLRERLRPLYDEIK